MTSEIILEILHELCNKTSGNGGDWDGWVLLDKYMVGTLIKTNFITNKVKITF